MLDHLNTCLSLIHIFHGVFVKEIKSDGAAQDAGIKTSDVILKINDFDVNTSAELQEQISKYRPKDKVKVTVFRDGKEKQVDVVLKNMYGDTNIVKANDGTSVLGARLTEVTEEEKANLGIKSGVKVADIQAGKFLKAGVEKGFIITRINNKAVSNVAEVQNILSTCLLYTSFRIRY